MTEISSVGSKEWRGFKKEEKEDQFRRAGDSPLVDTLPLKADSYTEDLRE